MAEYSLVQITEEKPMVVINIKIKLFEKENNLLKDEIENKDKKILRLT